jgi:hypothetical protein
VAPSSRDGFDGIHDLEILGQVVAVEPRIDAAEVVRVERVGGSDGAGQEAAAERRVRHEADPELAQHRQHLGLRVARPEGVLALHGRDGMHGVRPTDGVDRGLREPVTAQLAGLDQLGEGADGVFDRDLRVDAVLVIEIEVVGAKPAQRVVEGRAQVLGAAVLLALAARAVHDGELGCHDDAVSVGAERLSEKCLVGVGAVRLGGVEEGDAQVERAPDCADGFGVVSAGARVEGGHPHRAEPETGDVEGAECRVLHFAENLSYVAILKSMASRLRCTSASCSST